MRVVYGIAIVIGLAGVSSTQTPRSVWDGVYSADQAKRGQERYNAQCASCHGQTLEGGESAPPLAGGEFLRNQSVRRAELERNDFAAAVDGLDEVIHEAGVSLSISTLQENALRKKSPSPFYLNDPQSERSR